MSVGRARRMDGSNQYRARRPVRPFETVPNGEGRRTNWPGSSGSSSQPFDSLAKRRRARARMKKEGGVPASVPSCPALQAGCAVRAGKQINECFRNQCRSDQSMDHARGKNRSKGEGIAP